MNDEVSKKTTTQMPSMDTSEDKDLYSSDLPVGEILKITREKYKKTIPEISATLRIRTSLVEAIEKGEIEKLPGRVYAIGFVRSYAEYLSLDADKVVELFKIQHVGRRKRPEYVFPVSADESRMPGRLILGLCVVLILALVFYKSSQNMTFQSSTAVEKTNTTETIKDKQNAIPEVPKELLKDIKLPEKIEMQKKSEIQNEGDIVIGADTNNYSTPIISDAQGYSDDYLTPEGTITPHDTIKRTPKVRPSQDETLHQSIKSNNISTEQEQIKPVFNDNRVRITGLENSWMEIKDLGGQKVFSRVLKKSETYTLPDKNGLILSTSNAGGLEIRIGDRVLPSLGQTSQIRRNVNVDDLAGQ